MEIPSLKIPSLKMLLDDYAAKLDNPASKVSLEDVAAFERDFGIVLPVDYRDLVLEYDLCDVEVYFTRFSPSC